MNAGDLIKQKKDRVVYNSIQGQTKPANKTTPKRFEVVLQHRLGPKKVYSGKQVVLPACECGSGSGGGNYTMTTTLSTVYIRVNGTGTIDWGNGTIDTFSGDTIYSSKSTGGNITIVSTNLTYLDCGGNDLTSLNVSGFTSLQFLYCYNNLLTSLDVSGLISLTTLYCYNNQLTSLNVSGLISLNELRCYNNQLTSLNVSGLTSLTSLDCHDNQLTLLDLSGSLTFCSCYNNQLISLDVSSLTLLLILYCGNNQLSQSTANTIVGALEANGVNSGTLSILTVSPLVTNPGTGVWATLTTFPRNWSIS
jgi:hypothetical protein